MSVNNIWKYVVNHREKVTSPSGEVTGHKLNLDPDETEQLLRLIEQAFIDKFEIHHKDGT